jgi:hypothetical protein
MGAQEFHRTLPALALFMLVVVAEKVRHREQAVLEGVETGKTEETVFLELPIPEGVEAMVPITPEEVGVQAS